MEQEIYWEKMKGGKRKSFYSIPMEFTKKNGKVVLTKRPHPYIVYVEGVSKSTSSNPKGQDMVVVKSWKDAKRLSSLLKKVM